MSSKEKEHDPYTISPKDYFNVNQYRIDLWNQLKELASITERNHQTKIEQKKCVHSICDTLSQLEIIEQYWAYPGLKVINGLRNNIDEGEFSMFCHRASDIARILGSESYRLFSGHHNGNDGRNGDPEEILESQKDRHYFEVLFVDDISLKEQEELRERFDKVKDSEDKFNYEIIFAPSFQDAMFAMLFNYNIQCVVIRYGVKFYSDNDLKQLKPFATELLNLDFHKMREDELAFQLGKSICEFRPEVDLYYVTDKSLDQTDSEILNLFRRIFYRQEDVQEAHLSIRRGIVERFDAPFFKALVDYSQRPTGVFHAMPISRGNSVFKSNWIKEMGEFYGRNIFLAETSATTGGLDSLLQPVGPLKTAQQLASKAFGSQNTFFVTNGTSTANKIVLQGITKPGDVVLIDRDCHKSHHYAMVNSGVMPIYLDSYPIQSYSMYGAVPVSHIVEKLNLMKEEGRLDQVKMLILTNCTFDGLVYNVRKVMETVLAIKPDMIFLWDEAWFGFANFTHYYRYRSGMYTARSLFNKYNSDTYKKEYEKAVKNGSHTDMVDPNKVKIRVYSTQSTHKTLSSLRQGSMIHIYDEDFRRKTESTFLEAYMTHTSTSANYQILASLDVGRRQVMFEGYELVEKSIEMSMTLREKIINHPKLNRYFKVLTIQDLIPRDYRQSDLEIYYDPIKGWSRLEKGWKIDEFVLDPTKINLHIGNTGVNGNDFKNKYLMDQFGIQVNKTTRNSVLFMTNIGTTRSSVAYLTTVLLKIAEQLDEERRSMSREELLLKDKRVKNLTEENPPLPDFSCFHPFFKPNLNTPEGDIRKAFYMIYDENNCIYKSLAECESECAKGAQLVSATFVIPYPPGFPILVPGQVVSAEILDFMIKLDVKEIHGYKAELGLMLFDPEVLK